MSGGNSTTWQVLTKSRSGAVTDVLTSLLDSPDPGLVQCCLTTLIRRRDPAGHQAILARFDRFDESILTVLADLPGRMTSALRIAITAGDGRLMQNALTAACHLREYDLIPALVAAAEAKGDRADRAAAALFALAQHLHEELSGERRSADHRDPERIRGAVLPALQESMGRHAIHGRRAIVDAFLLLAPRSSKTVAQILNNSEHACHAVVLEELESTEHERLVSQLLAISMRSGAPRPAVRTLGRRSDLHFVQQLLRSIDPQRMEPLHRNLKHVEHIAWIQPDAGILPQLAGPEQTSAVAFVMASGVAREEAFELLKYLLKNGKPEGRQAACAALAEFQSEAADELILNALKDECPDVQAEAVKQLRARNMQGALARLVRLLDSPHEPVRDAARASLREFSFERYRAAFDFLADQTRVSAGGIVKKVDLALPEELRRELVSLARSRRIRAIEMTSASGAVEKVEQQLIESLNDEDHIIRAAAAWALGRSGTAASREALLAALSDRSVAVQQAAKESLAEMFDAADEPVSHAG